MTTQQILFAARELVVSIRQMQVRADALSRQEFASQNEVTELRRLDARVVAWLSHFEGMIRFETCPLSSERTQTGIAIGHYAPGSSPSSAPFWIHTPQDWHGKMDALSEAVLARAEAILRIEETTCEQSETHIVSPEEQAEQKNAGQEKSTDTSDRADNYEKTLFDRMEKAIKEGEAKGWKQPKCLKPIAKELGIKPESARRRYSRLRKSTDKENTYGQGAPIL